MWFSIVFWCFLYVYQRVAEHFSYNPYSKQIGFVCPGLEANQAPEVQFQWSNWIDFTLYIIYIMYYIYYVLYMICDILYYMFYIIYNHSFTFSPQRYHGGFIGFNPQDVSPVSRPGIRSSPSLPSQVSWSSGAPRDQKRALKRKRWVTKTGCTMDISWLYRYTTGNGHITMDISHYQYMMEI